MPLFGPPNIWKMKSNRDVNGLIKALNYKNTGYVPCEAARALGELRDAHAVEPLIAALKDEDTKLRQYAAEALGEIRDRRAVEPLIAALGDKDPVLHHIAVGALGKIGDTRAVEPLIAVLNDKDSQVRLNAAVTLDKIGWQPSKDSISAAYWIAKQNWDACATIGAPAVEPLIAALKDKDLREEAAKTLGKIGDTRAVEPLIAALKNEGVRTAAADALWRICDEHAVGPLLEAMRDTEKDVRWEASLLLRKIGDARAVEPLIAALKDQEMDVRNVAAEALGQIGDKQAVEPLIATLKDESANVRRKAAEALEKIGWKPGIDETGAIYWIAKPNWEACAKIGAPAIGPLIAALKYEEVRTAAADALDEIGWQPFNDEAGVTYWIAKHNWEECVRIGTPAVEPLITALKGQDPIERRVVVKALISLYKAEHLHERDKKLILAHRLEITSPHDDMDFGSSCTGSHSDVAAIEFPL